MSEASIHPDPEEAPAEDGEAGGTDFSNQVTSDKDINAVPSNAATFLYQYICYS